MAQLSRQDRTLGLSGPVTLMHLEELEVELRSAIVQSPPGAIAVDLRGVERLDTAGAAFLDRIEEVCAASGRRAEIGELPESLRAFYDFVHRERPAAPAFRPAASGTLEALGGRIALLNVRLVTFLLLASDLTWAALSAIVRRRGVRRGALVEQAVAVGSSALPIVALILFLIGAVSSLQAAAQLRKFGADIFVAELLAIGITRELGPLMTAIIVAGRSGSAIAAEVATMKFTEELDALRTMDLDPLRFVAVPKLWAMVLCLPMLTIMADVVGILGGTWVGISLMGIAPAAFVDQVLGALFLRDVATGLIKSVSFAWAITIIGVHRGLDFSGGAAGVGRATTSSVVISIFGIIILDCFWGLLFYLR